MDRVVKKLQTRRKMMFVIVFVVGMLAVIVDSLFDIQAVDYFELRTQTLIVYGLIFYKLIELFIIYFIFYKRHLNKYLHAQKDETLLSGFEKNAKRFFMLVPQGNIVFGIISYKFTGSVEYLYLFLSFALITLCLVDPKKAMKL